jgi:hypothetical protein
MVLFPSSLTVHVSAVADHVPADEVPGTFPFLVSGLQATKS